MVNELSSRFRCLSLWTFAFTTHKVHMANNITFFCSFLRKGWVAVQYLPQHPSACIYPHREWMAALCLISAWLLGRCGTMGTAGHAMARLETGLSYSLCRKGAYLVFMKILELILTNTGACLDLNGLTGLTHCCFPEEHGASPQSDKK